MAETEGATTTEAPAEATPAGPDYGPVFDRMDQLASQVQSLTEDFQTRVPAPEPEAEPEFDYSQYDTQDPAQAQRLLQDMIERSNQTAVKPLQDQLQQFQADHAQLKASIDAQALETKYPQMQDETYARSLLETASQQAQHIAPTPEAAQALAFSTGFLELVHLAQMGSERAAGETPAGGRTAASLESANGGTPGGAETSLADQIRAVRGPRNSVFGFNTGA